jgi:hypothetical protein
VQKHKYSLCPWLSQLARNTCVYSVRVKISKYLFRVEFFQPPKPKRASSDPTSETTRRLIRCDDTLNIDHRPTQNKHQTTTKTTTLLEAFASLLTMLSNILLPLCVLFAGIIAATIHLRNKSSNLVRYVVFSTAMAWRCCTSMT